VALHVNPINDLHEHIIETVDGVCSCPCQPKYTESEDGELIVIHNSFDGREVLEIDSDCPGRLN